MYWFYLWVISELLGSSDTVMLTHYAVVCTGMSTLHESDPYADMATYKMLYKISAVHPVYKLVFAWNAFFRRSRISSTSVSIIMLSRLMLSIRSSDENLHSDYGHIEATKPTICYLSTVNGFSSLPGERDFLEEEEV